MAHKLTMLALTLLLILMMSPASPSAHDRQAPAVAPVRSPDRILFLGDSLSASLAAALEASLDERGIDFGYRGYPGTGPLTDQGRFWREQLGSGLLEFDPDLVVVQSAGNYNVDGADPFCPGKGDGPEAWVPALLRRMGSVCAAPGPDQSVSGFPRSSDHGSSHG